MNWADPILTNIILQDGLQLFQLLLKCSNVIQIIQEAQQIHW